MDRYSILVVEDEHTLRRLLEYRLSKQYDVRTAANGAQALERIEEGIPDLIISDIMMPQMDGFTLQAALQQARETRAIPFIFLTAKADEQSRLKGMRTGVDDYITKPFDIEQLLSRIKLLLERTKIFQEQLGYRIGQDFSKRLMPKELPQVPGYRFLMHNNPRDHGGGDLFDVSQKEPGSYFITIGDVMGKGLQAKFYAYSFLGYVRSTLQAMLQDSRSPAELMRRLNRMLIQDSFMQDTFASLLLMRWEPAEHRITYANAGHCRPILVTPHGTEIVDYSDMVLGLDPTTRFLDSELILPPRSALLSYTDGLIEQRVSAVETDEGMIGEAGVLALARQALSRSHPIDFILDGVLEQSLEPEFSDDILIFWLERQT